MVYSTIFIEILAGIVGKIKMLSQNSYKQQKHFWKE